MSAANRGSHAVGSMSDRWLPPRRGFVQLAAVILCRAIRRIVKHVEDQRQYDRLLGMPDDQLADLGLTRDDVIRAKSKPLLLGDLWKLTP